MAHPLAKTLKMSEAQKLRLSTALHMHGVGATQEYSAPEAQLQATLTVIPAHTWYALPSGALTFVSQRTADYLGLPKDHPLRFGIDTGAAWDSHIPLLHPDDHDATRKVWSTCLRTACAGEVTFRVRNAEGEYRWFLSRAEPLRSSDQTLLYWIGVNLEIDDAKRAEDALRKSEKELRDVIDTIPAAVWSALPDGSNTYVNKRFVEYSGMSAEETAGSGWQAATHPDDLEQHARKWREAVVTGKPHENEVRFRRSDGQYRWQLDRGVPLRDEDGNILKWYGVVTDIEDRKRAEEVQQLMSCELQDSKAKLEEAQRITHVGYWEWDLVTNRVNWSDETYRIHGLRPQERALDLAAVGELIHPEDWGFVSRAIDEALAGGPLFNIECRVVRPTGEIRILHGKGDVKRDASGQPYQMFGTTQDITERKRAEKCLQQSEFYLAEGQRLAHLGSWAWTVPKRDAVHLSDEWYRIYGFDPKDGMPAWEERLNRIHPEDRNKWREAIDEAILKKSNYEVEFRILLPDGTLKWIHTIGHPVSAPSGELVQFVGSSMDVTLRKRAQEKLKEQETELRQMLDLAPQLVTVFGPGREPLYANSIWLDYLGITLDEWRRRDCHEFIHPEEKQGISADSERAFSAGSAFELQFRLRKSDGRYRWFLTRYSPVHDDDGRIIRWYVASTDIEDRKRAEERLQEENAALREEIDRASMFEEIVGTSSALRTLLSNISKVAPSNSTVLITGETGTGKELVARAIHRRSVRSSRAFVSVNCAAMPRDLIASELFGHERGAFTGATQRRLGRFELADGGTIFLDEVGELLPETQAALLRVLQEQEIERVGGMQSICVNVRVIAATNRNLKEAVANGSFRPDLFYRLNVVPIEVPSLRDRKEDILMLIEYFVQRYATKVGKSIRAIDKKALDLLQSYDWPGNIRELQNVIERSVILSSGEILSVDELWLSKEIAVPASHVELQPTVKSDAEPRSEREIIEAALAASRGRVGGSSGAAAKLKIPPSTLDRWIRALRIDKSRFKFL